MTKYKGKATKTLTRKRAEKLIGEHIVIPDGYSAIGEKAFANRREIISITFPSSLVDIGYGAFYACTSLKDITIPDSVTKIGEWAFYATALTNIAVSASVTKIGECAFVCCNFLADITVNSDNPSYSSQDGALFNKDKTTLIKIPAEKTGAYTVPDSVTELARYAIDECRLLAEITIPAGIKENLEIDIFNPFDHCMALERVTIDPDNPSYSSRDGVLFNKDKTTLIFYPPGKTDKTYVIPDTVTKIGVKAFEGNPYFTSVTIPDSVKKIESKAFSDCTGLTEMFIPASVEHIHQYVFSHCNALKVLTISGDNPNYTSEHKVLFNKDKTVLIEYSDREAEDDYIIPGSVKSIDWFAFCGCKSLKSVVIPEGVKHIGMHAFEGCSGLTEIMLPSTMTLIDHDTFSKCSNLRKITIPDSITEIDIGPVIEAYPFYGCHPEAVASYKGKTYKAVNLVCGYGKPYTNLPEDFYEAFNQTPPDPNTFTIVVSICSGES